MLILGLQGEAQLSRVISVVSTVGDTRGEGDVIRGSRNRRSGHFSLFLAPVTLSCQPSNIPLFCEYGVCDWKRSEAYNFPPPPTPSWHRKVAKTMFWEWAGAWKRCQRGSWPWRAQTPLVQEDRFHFSFRMCAPLRLHKGSLLSCHRLPGARNELPRGISSLCY